METGNGVVVVLAQEVFVACAAGDCGEHRHKVLQIVGVGPEVFGLTLLQTELVLELHLFYGCMIMQLMDGALVPISSIHQHRRLLCTHTS